jgi:SAM-dependent methyltransferase
LHDIPESGIAARDVYQQLGLVEYFAVDKFDPRATLTADLGTFLSLDRSFDVVTNFGTVQHVFDQATAWSNVHDLTRVGGIMLHYLPLSRTNGYFSYGKRFILDLIEANLYELVDCRVFHLVECQETQLELLVRRRGQTPPIDDQLRKSGTASLPRISRIWLRSLTSGSAVRAVAKRDIRRCISGQSILALALRRMRPESFSALQSLKYI